MKTYFMFVLALVGCVGETSTIEGTGPDPTPASGATLAEGTYTAPEQSSKPSPAPPAPSTTAKTAPTSSSTTPPTPSPAPSTTPLPVPLEYGQTLLDRWCTQVTQCATQGYPGYGPMAACEWQLTLQGKWACQESEWSPCATAISETNCGSNLPTICAVCTGGQGAKLP